MPRDATICGWRTWRSRPTRRRSAHCSKPGARAPPQRETGSWWFRHSREIRPPLSSSQAPTATTSCRATQWRRSARAALPGSAFVHFGYHADQNLQDPAQGGLPLSDGILRVFDLATLPLDGEYAALAACKTAVGGTSLLDESITLAAALHYTGFRHVIGTLWSLSDQAAVAVFEQVYRELTGTGRFVPDGAARALSRATTLLRRAGARIHTWAPLIHIGP